MSEWIEIKEGCEMPKDIVLVYCPPYTPRRQLVNDRIAEAWWDERGQCWHYPPNNLLFTRPVTHWMPRPEPPNATHAAIGDSSTETSSHTFSHSNEANQ